MTVRDFACALAVLAGAGAVVWAQAAPAEWTLTYAISGGIAGISRRVTITSSGRLQLDDRRLGHVEVAADNDLFVRARDFVATAREVAPRPASPAYPDQMSVDLSVTSEGRTRQVEASPAIVNALVRAPDQAVAQALVGRWREASWTFCTPEARQSPEDVDPPIAELAINPGGTFSVHWPGGPHTTGDPQHTSADYSGNYRVTPASGAIEFIPADATGPRHFSGRGTFRFDGDRLVLGSVWLGTHQAMRKPDICELSFARK